MGDLSSQAPLIKNFRKQIDESIIKYISNLGEETALKNACEYALLSGGKRLRPAIAMIISEAIGKKHDVLPSALAIEFFHTASLIADDLPCMDDELERRNKATVHRVYGENVALLASYSLISAGYEQIAYNAEILKEHTFPSKYTSDQLCVIILKKIAKLGGIFGATNGQFLDLFPPDFSFQTLCKVIEQKTITLFEITFILGWLFGGGELLSLDKVLGCSYHFGLAFQIADDILDVDQDKTNKCSMNIASFLGEKKAEAFFYKQIDACISSLKELNILTPAFEELCNILVLSIKRTKVC